MTQVLEHGAWFFLNLDYVKLEQVVHYASNLEMGHSYLEQQNTRRTYRIIYSSKKKKNFKGLEKIVPEKINSYRNQLQKDQCQYLLLTPLTWGNAEF